MTSQYGTGCAEEFVIHHVLDLHRHEEADFRRRALRRLAKNMVRKGVVLDIGCGTGYMTLQLLREGNEVTAIDISNELISITESRARREGFSLRAMTMSADEVRILGQGVFDTIICLDVLEHIENDVKALIDLSYVCKDDGVILIVVPAIKSLFGHRDELLGHFRRYSKTELVSKAAAANLTVIKIQYWNLLGVFPYWFFEKVLRREIYDGLRSSGRSPVKGLVTNCLTAWLVLESRLPVPVGLSIIAILGKCAKV